ncbi:IclR family transcriptional regulator [Victivallis sp.]|uniref:IclR family transcriptional regulator n=1 Tax=Victivallis sp. TaxID=2049020 RepID=UPI003A93FE57
MVIKVLEKVFAILEFVASRQGRPVLPAEIVQALDINQTTCIRLLKDLVENGYLSQISRTRGYVTGPTAVWIGKNSLFQSQRHSICEPILRDAAPRENISMLVAVRHGKYRVLICGCNAPTGVQLNMSLPRFPDLFCSATGIMLLAHTPAEELTRLIPETVIPETPPWHAGITRAEIDLKLYTVRTSGEFRHQAFGVEACAAPIFSAGKLQAALGGAWRAALPAAQRDELAGKLRAVAATISASLGDGLRHI